MLTISLVVLAAVVGIVVFYLIWSSLDFDFGAFFFGLFVGGVVFGILFIVISFIVTSFVTSEENRVKDEVTTVELQSVGTGDTVNGYYRYIESGSAIKFTYSSVDENGQKFFVVDQVDSDDARIYEDADGTATMDKITKVYENSSISPEPYVDDSSTVYKFHVPAGTVVEDYTVPSK